MDKEIIIFMIYNQYRLIIKIEPTIEISMPNMLLKTYPGPEIDHLAG